MGVPIADVLTPTTELLEAIPDATSLKGLTPAPAVEQVETPILVAKAASPVVEQPGSTLDAPVKKSLASASLPVPVVVKYASSEPTQLAEAVDKLSLAAEPAPEEDANTDVPVNKATQDDAAVEAPTEQVEKEKKSCPCCSAKAKKEDE